MSLAFAVEARKNIKTFFSIDKNIEEFNSLGIITNNKSKYSIRIGLPGGNIVEEDYSWVLRN